MNTTEKATALKTIWARTHRDFKGTFAGAKTIMVCRAGGTVLVRLTDLTEAEIAGLLPRKG